VTETKLLSKFDGALLSILMTRHFVTCNLKNDIKI
jgi:hypothetical protein